MAAIPFLGLVINKVSAKEVKLVHGDRLKRLRPMEPNIGPIKKGGYIEVETGIMIYNLPGEKPRSYIEVQKELEKHNWKMPTWVMEGDSVEDITNAWVQNYLTIVYKGQEDFGGHKDKFANMYDYMPDDLDAIADSLKRKANKIRENQKI